MNWWSILKNVQNPPQGVPQMDWYNTQQSPPQPRQLPTKIPQYDPTRSPQGAEPIDPELLPESNTAVGNQQVEAGDKGQKNVLSNEFMKPALMTPDTTQNAPQDTSGGEATSSEDDSDVGNIRQNVDAAKRNLSQLPRGPKAAELTEILNLISQASIDPVKQKEIAVEAKKKLHSIFPSSMA